MVQDLESFVQESHVHVDVQNAALQNIRTAKESIKILVKEANARLESETSKMMDSFSKFMDGRSIQDFMDEEFVKAVYFVGGNSNRYLHMWRSAVTKAITANENFYVLDSHWKQADVQNSYGAPVWILSAQPFRWKNYGSSAEMQGKKLFEESFKNTAETLPSIFDVCSSLTSENYSMKISDCDGLDNYATGDFCLTKSSRMWVVNWISMDDEGELTKEESHSESTVEAILDWIVKNVWDSEKRDELVEFGC